MLFSDQHRLEGALKGLLPNIFTFML